MRKILTWLCCGVAAFISVQPAEAGFVGLPRHLNLQTGRIQTDGYAMGPAAYARFCVQYPDDCRKTKHVFRGGPVKLSRDRARELAEVNRGVNSAIVPERNELGLAGERWLIAPKSGDCNDYAVTKRHELLVRGWPSRALLLSEVVTSWGEHHIVLVVRTDKGDLVLDSLTLAIRKWTAAPYQWVRIQTAIDPRLWATVAAWRVRPARVDTASASPEHGLEPL